jgi:hypothetical protein
MRESDGWRNEDLRDHRRKIGPARGIVFSPRATISVRSRLYIDVVEHLFKHHTHAYWKGNSDPAIADRRNSLRHDPNLPDHRSSCLHPMDRKNIGTNASAMKPNHLNG